MASLKAVIFSDDPSPSPKKGIDPPSRFHFFIFSIISLLDYEDKIYNPYIKKKNQTWKEREVKYFCPWAILV